MSVPMSDATVELFTQAHCAGCKDVERYLEKRGIAFTLRQVDRDEAALEALAAQGFMSTPVTHIGDRWIVGFKPRDIEQALAALDG